MQIVIVDPGWKSFVPPMPFGDAKSCGIAGDPPVVEFAPYLDYSASEIIRDCDSDMTLNGVLCKSFEGGLDHVVASVGLRNTDCGDIELAGVPGTASLAGAWLYVGRLEKIGSPVPLAISVLFNGVKLRAYPVGLPVDQPCWDDDADNGFALDFRAYRAIVTNHMLSSINGKYEVSLSIGLTTANDGSDPWQTHSGGPPILEGASLVALFADASVSATSRVTINEGPAYLWPSLIVANPVTSTPVAGDTARLSRLGSDGQQRIAGVADLPVLPLATRFGVGLAWEHIAGPNSAINPNTDFGGDDGGPMRQLQDGEMTEWVLKKDFGSASSYTVTYEPIHIDPVANAGLCVWVDCINVIAHVMTVK